jgi:hypothetical protein
VRAGRDDGDLTKDSFGFRQSARAGALRASVIFFDLRPHTRLLRFSVLGSRRFGHRHILDLSSLHFGGPPQDYLLAANPRRAS